MNCKENCIHYAACADLLGVTNSFFTNPNIRCADFEDKSLYIKLPCHTGDRVYTYNKEGNITEGIIMSIYKNYVGGASSEWTIAAYYPTYDKRHDMFLPINISYTCEDFNKIVFIGDPK